MRDNEAAYNRYKIRPRVLVDVLDLDSTIEMFGSQVRLQEVSRARIGGHNPKLKV